MIKMFLMKIIHCRQTIASVLIHVAPPPRYPSGRVLAASAGGPGSISSQGPRHTKDVIKMVPVVTLFNTQH